MNQPTDAPIEQGAHGPSEIKRCPQTSAGPSSWSATLPIMLKKPNRPIRRGGNKGAC